MSKQAIELAISALEMYCEHGAILRPIETLDTLREALKTHGEEAAKDRNTGQGCNLQALKMALASIPE